MKPLFLALTLLTAIWSKAQSDSVLIGGYVYSADDGDPMPFAKVKIPGLAYSAFSDINGVFSLQIPAGILVQKPCITVQEIGYEFDTLRLDASGNHKKIKLYGKRAGIALGGELPPIDPEELIDPDNKDPKFLAAYRDFIDTLIISRYYNKKGKLHRETRSNPACKNYGAVTIYQYDHTSKLISYELTAYSLYHTRITRCAYRFYGHGKLPG